MPSRFLAGVVALTLLICGSHSVLAQPAGPKVQVLQTDGQLVEGRIRTWDASGLVLTGETARTVPHLQIVSLSWPGRVPERPKESPVVLFANGDRLSAQPLASNEETVDLHWPYSTADTSLPIPLETVRGWVVSPPEEDDRRRKLFDLVLNPARQGDVVFLKNGDELTGELLGLQDAAMRIKVAGTESAVRAEAIRAVALNPDLTQPAQLAVPRAWILFTDGSRLQGKNLARDGEVLAFETLAGIKLRVALARVLRIHWQHAQCQPLSEIPPTASVARPFLRRQRETQRDRSALGSPLTVRGVEYAKGFGVQSYQELRWNLDAKYRRLLVSCGVDDAARREGSVTFSIQVDGKAVFTSPVLTGVSDVLKVEPVDLTGAKTLALIVDFAYRGDILDYADWIEPVLIP